LTELESEQKNESADNAMKSKGFANLWVGIFFMVSSISLVVVMSMFIFVWQPIWTEGFKDFHTISGAIGELNKTAQPASDSVPLMLAEMNKMNQSMDEMKTIMRDMDGSMNTLEEITPNIKKMTVSIEHMTVVIANQMTRMAYLMNRMKNKIPDMDFMPFN